jgi:PiT family inorganic phosphate transporter
VLRGISIGWVITPLIAGVISFIALFFFQNVFNQQTYRQVSYSLTLQALDRIGGADIDVAPLSDMTNKAYLDAITFSRALDTRIRLTWEQKNFVMESAKVADLTVSKEKIGSATADGRISRGQADAIRALEGRTFVHPWLLYETLARLSPEWRMAAGEGEHNRKIARQLNYLHRLFQH